MIDFPTSLIPLLIDHMHSELKPQLITVRPSTLEKLTDLAISLETTLFPNLEPKKANPTVKGADFQGQDSNNPPPYRHCPERHLHRDCPIWKQK